MKKKLLTGFLLSFVFLLAVQSVQAQITVQFKNKPLKEALRIIEQNSGYSFFYSSTLPTDTKVSLDVKNKNIEEVLDRVFKDLDIDYEIKSDRQITLAPKVREKRVQRSSKPMVSGIVKDESGRPIIGASVVVEGTANGVTTDRNGYYSIAVTDGDVLSFEYLGYNTQQIDISGRTTINVVLKEGLQVMEEVVVVGYGTQKKVNLTGSVAVIDSKELAARPITNVATGLQGLLPGVTVTNVSGQPGVSSTTIRVRGIGTLGNSNPLILVDGIESDITALNPEDIESVSVLKDAAAAAIYGARAANGVLLITTRKLNSGGDVKSAINFSSYVGVQTPTRLPEMCNAIEFMTLDNEARANVGTPKAWLQEQFDKVTNNSDPNHFADTNWVGAVLNAYAPQQNYGLNVNGNVGQNGYMLSYRYFDQGGLTVGNSTGEQRHNLRFKLDLKLLDCVTVSSNIGYTYRNIVSPISSLASGGGAIYNAMRIAPNAPILYTDGTWAYGGGNTNPVAILTDGGNSKTVAEQISVSEVMKIDLMKGWNMSVTYNLTSDNGFKEVLKKTIVFLNPESGSTYNYNMPNSLSNSYAKNLQQTLFAQTNFDFSFGRHNISGVAGMEQEWLRYRYFDASRSNLITEKNPTLNLGDATTMSNGANSTSWAIRSFFGRVSYNYNERYLLELNMRYDMSSRFHPDHRVGKFPSVSAGWRLSEEKFMEFSREWFDNIKLRASWGQLGNQYVGSSDYPYMSVLSAYTTDLSLIGTNATTGYTQSVLSNPKLSWETINMFDAGIDLLMLSNRLSLSFDWFTKDTNGILLQLNYPAQIGAIPSEENAGSMNNKGWELALSWRDRIGDFSYGLGFNLSDVKNKITDLAGNQPDLSGDQIRRVGDPIDAFYGYIAEGLMTADDFEIYDSTTKKYELPKIPVVLGYDYEPGDIKYKDISGPNGIPDGRISPEYDKTVIGSNIPRYTYSFRGDMAYKNFDFSINIQGVGKCDGYLTGTARHAFQDMAAYPQKTHLQRFNIETNPNPQAAYPRLTYNTGFNQNTFSTFWLEDASYLRVKNIQVGYSLPSKWLKKIRIDKCRFYLSGDNLFTISDFFYAYDPETPVSKGGYYPQVKTFVLGVSVTFK